MTRGREEQQMTLQISDDGRVRTLTLNRPDVLNAFNEGLYEATTIALREAGTDPDVAVDTIGTGRSVLAGPFQVLRGLGMTAVGLGAITLLLAMAGLYGIQSHIIANRTREIGVRMSLGATAGQIKRMVLVDGYRPVLDGLIFGLSIGLVGRAIARAYLELDVAIVDPWMLVVTPIPLICAAFFACYLPARRAAAVDPNVALRSE